MLAFTRKTLVRHATRKPTFSRAHLEVTTLEERLVPSGVTGFSFVEAQGFPTPLTTVVSRPTAFQDQIDATWQDILSGKQLLAGGETLQQQVSDSIQNSAAKQGLSAYNISENFAKTG